MIPTLVLGFLLYKKQITIELFSALTVILIAVAGYIYQTGENRKMQDIEYKRETYAILMENLAIFKRQGNKTPEDARKMEKNYFRSWVETSDEVNKKLLAYLEAYNKWSSSQSSENKKLEIEKFDDLAKQIKTEVNSSSKAIFKPYYFQLKEAVEETRED